MRKEQILLCWIICGWAAIILSGCLKPAQSIIQMVEQRQSVQATFTPFLPVAPTATPQPSPTVTVLPSPTAIVMPSPTAVPCSGEQGWMEQHTRAEGAPLDFRIYLPPCYGKLEEVVYPVLYILHGQTYKDDQWDRLGMDEAAEALIRAGEAPPFLIVMPLEANTLADPFETLFGTHLAEELVPWIDAQYATCPERECRAIGGLSRGGAWALNTGFRYWELFGAIGLHSTPPFLNDPYRLTDWLRAIPDGQLPRLWLDTGKLDWYLKITTEFEGLLVNNNVPHEWYLFNGTHDEAYWAAHVDEYLAWYSAPWQERFPNLP